MENMEGLSIDNILGAEDIENLFTEFEETEGATPEESGEQIVDKDTTEVDVDNLFTEGPESVGSEETEDEEDTNSDTGTSDSPKKNFYSSIAKALKEDGVFPDLDDETLKGIKDPAGFTAFVEKQIAGRLDEKQKRIDAALNAGVDTSELRRYENSISYLKNIQSTAITNEAPEGETLRKQLIFQDYVNRGYSKDRATREVQKSFNAGTDIEDAKEALTSNLQFYTEEYNDIIEDQKEAQAEVQKKRTQQIDDLQANIMSADKTFQDIPINQSTRQRIFDNIVKPQHKDPATGEMLTALQKYERENRIDFLKNIGMVFTLTDGFKNFDALSKNKVKKELNKGLRELEHTLNNTARTSDGNLKFVSGVTDDSESYIGKGWSLDI